MKLALNQDAVRGRRATAGGVNLDVDRIRAEIAQAQSGAAQKLLLGGDAIDLADVPRLLPTRRGRRVHRITIWRWVTKGVCGPGGVRVRLDTVKLGGSRYTSLAAVERFAAALDGLLPSEGRLRTGRTEAQRSRRVEAAKRELRAAGMM